MEIGQILKEERERQGLSLDDIQEMTKIQKRYLNAIEDNQFSNLPGRFYARAFIKEYAIVLQLDADELLEQFDREIELEEEDTTQYQTVRRTRRARAPKSSAILSFFPTVIVVLLIVGILFIAWTLTQKAFNNNSDNDPTTESDQVIRDVDKPEKEVAIGDDEAEDEGLDEKEDQVEEEEEKLDASFRVDQVGTGRSPQSDLTFTYQGSSLLLSFDVEAETYISIVGESGKNYYDGILSPSESIDPIDLSGEGNVFLNVGNSSGLTIKLNEVEMDYPVDPNQYVHQKFLITFDKQ